MWTYGLMHQIAELFGKDCGSKNHGAGSQSIATKKTLPNNCGLHSLGKNLSTAFVLLRTCAHLLLLPPYIYS